MLGLVRGGIANAPPDVFAAGNVYHSRQGRELLREGYSLNLKATRFERHEVIARPPLGRGTGKNRDVATAVIVEILNTPLTQLGFCLPIAYPRHNEANSGALYQVDS